MKIKITNAYRNIVAIADKELIGKQFEEGKRFLDVKPSFYDGEQKTEDEIRELLRFHKKEDATFNFVGEKIINIAIEEGIIHEESIGRVDNIPYAIILL